MNPSRMNAVRIAQQADFGHIPLNQYLGGTQDSRFLSLRQDNMPAIRFGSSDEFVFEHDRGDPSGADYRDAVFELRHIDMGFKES